MYEEVHSFSVGYSSAIAFVPALLAQTPTGTIEGGVTDPQGAVVAGANVAVIEKATGRTITLTTNDQGFYTVPSLSPGVYSVRIEKTGFSTANVETVVVQVGLVARADVGLKVGSQSEVVQVDIGATDV